MEPNTLEELRRSIMSLQQQVNTLSAQFNKNNFPSSQIFNKNSIFNMRLRVPVYSGAPSIAEVGDLIAISGRLFICTTASTGGGGAMWTLVGSQI